MAPHKATTAGDPRGPSESLIFTPQHANRALVLVRRIVADVVARYRYLADRRRERERLLRSAANRGQHNPATAARHERLEELNDNIARCTEELKELNRELLAAGCVLKDWRTGLVDFPAVHQGRRVWLCWRLGEPAVAHWHDLHAGVEGRVPIPPDF